MRMTLRSSKASVKGAIEIGKLNTLLIALIVVILVSLISKEVETTTVDDQTVLVQSQAVAEADPTVIQDNPPAEVAEEAEPLQPEAEVIVKKPKKNKALHPVTASKSPAAEQLVQNQAPSQGAPVSDHTDDVEPSAQKDPSKYTMVFSIWSVSELRLRSTYTKVMNEGADSASQLQAKKEYLHFVNKRTHKCGELDEKFTSNINTAEKLTFNEKSIKTLECHTSENITELARVRGLSEH